MHSLVAEGLGCVRGERLVFSDLDLNVSGGEVVAVVGPNGAGKSSLLRLLAGLMPPSAGHILFDGTDIADDPDPLRVELHYVGHADALKPVMSVAENLNFWAALRERPIDLYAALERLGMADLADIPVRYLSAGQRRRANLARLLATSAAVWLLDEPTTALDNETSATVEAMLSDHAAAGGIVIVATHHGLNVPGLRTLAMALAPVPVPC